VNSLPKTATRQRRDCDSNPCSSEPESGTLTTQSPSHPTSTFTLTQPYIIRLHRMHEIPAIAIDLLVRQSCVTRLRCANTAEWLEVLLGAETLRDPRNTVLDRSSYFSHRVDATFATLLWTLVKVVNKRFSCCSLYSTVNSV